LTLVPGSRLGSYEIVAPLGAGGMGEVWRAKDPRLGREVAIKVLPADVADDPVLLRRFEDEARAASALNHPNILTVHELGREGGTSFLVTELLAGESLRESSSATRTSSRSARRAPTPLSSPSFVPSGRAMSASSAERAGATSSAKNLIRPEAPSGSGRRPRARYALHGARSRFESALD
jgi:serine/threonine protein kinase